MQGKWSCHEVAVAVYISDHPVIDDPHLLLQPVDATGDTTQGGAGKVLSFYIREFYIGRRLYGAGGGIDRQDIPFAPVILYICKNSFYAIQPAKR
jgi:hypothetical protein